MAQLPTQPTNNNELQASRYRLVIPKLPMVNYFCSKVSIPSAGIGTVNQPTNFNPIKRPGGAVNHSQLTVEFLVQEDLRNWAELMRWLRECSNYINYDEYENPAEHLSDSSHILIMTNAQNPKYKFTFDGLWPTSIGNLDFSSADDTYLKCTATFEFTSMELVPLSSEESS